MWSGLDDIERRTGCQKPCIFRKYSFPGDKQVVLQISIMYYCIWQIFIMSKDIKIAGDLTEIGPFHFLLDRLFKLHKRRDGAPHLSPFLIGR